MKWMDILIGAGVGAWMVIAGGYLWRRRQQTLYDRDTPSDAGSAQWGTVVEPNSGDEHRIPIADTRTHLYLDCWCDPWIDDRGDYDYYTHNSADEREQYEKGARKPH